MNLIETDWLDRPLAKRVAMRRSTALLLGAFVVLTMLFVQTRPDREDEDAPDVVHVVPVATDLATDSDGR